MAQNYTFLWLRENKRKMKKKHEPRNKMYYWDFGLYLQLD